MNSIKVGTKLYDPHGGVVLVLSKPKENWDSYRVHGYKFVFKASWLQSNTFGPRELYPHVVNEFYLNPDEIGVYWRTSAFRFKSNIKKYVFG